jgi:hypothetical protein
MITKIKFENDYFCLVLYIFTVTLSIPESDEFVGPPSTSNSGSAVRKGTRRFINDDTWRRSRMS